MASSYDNAISYWPVSLYSPSLGNVTATQQEFNICVTAAGSTVFMVASSGVANIKVMSDMVNPNTSNITTQYNLTIADYSATTANLCVGLAPLYGDVVIMTYTTNTANLPAFALFNACPYNAGTVTTAGVTTSNGIALSPNMGYAFAGVASTTATANTVGQIQTNGVATLNSSYSASTTTQNFDAQNNTGVGVKGSITGRSVILQGNT